MDYTISLSDIQDDKKLIKFLIQKSIKYGKKTNIECSHCGSLKNLSSDCDCVDLNQCYICHELGSERNYCHSDTYERFKKLYDKRDKTKYNKKCNK